MKAIRGRDFLTALISRRRPTPYSLTLMTAYARSSFLGEDRLKESAAQWGTVDRSTSQRSER